jgi:hypothetical protein
VKKNENQLELLALGKGKRTAKIKLSEQIKK